MPEPDAADAGESQDAFDEAVRAKGECILAAGRQNVTSLQARAGSMGERDSRAYWRGPSDSARRLAGGTARHAVPRMG